MPLAVCDRLYIEAQAPARQLDWCVCVSPDRLFAPALESQNFRWGTIISRALKTALPLLALIKGGSKQKAIHIWVFERVIKSGLEKHFHHFAPRVLFYFLFQATVQFVYWKKI